MLNFLTHPLIESAWLAEYLSDGDMCIVDARWRRDGSSRDLYSHRHLPGAIHLDWYHDLSWTDTRGARNLLLPASVIRVSDGSGGNRRSNACGGHMLKRIILELPGSGGRCASMYMIR